MAKVLLLLTTSTAMHYLASMLALLSAVSSRWRPTALLTQALITFPVLKTMTLISDSNIKPQSTSFFIAKAAWYDPPFGFPATCETPWSNGVYRIAIFYLPLNKQGHSSQVLQWHNSVSTVKVVTCEQFEPGKYRLPYEDRRYGRRIVNGSCSWPAGGVDGMVMICFTEH